MRFTDDEVLLLLDLDLQLDLDLREPTTTRWARVRNAAWWVALAFGSVAVMYLVLQADYGFHPSRFPG